jgi:hypothetical protein
MTRPALRRDQRHVPAHDAQDGCRPPPLQKPSPLRTSPTRPLTRPARTPPLITTPRHLLGTFRGELAVQVVLSHPVKHARNPSQRVSCYLKHRVSRRCVKCFCLWWRRVNSLPHREKPHNHAGSRMPFPKLDVPLTPSRVGLGEDTCGCEGKQGGRTTFAPFSLPDNSFLKPPGRRQWKRVQLQSHADRRDTGLA